MELSGDTLSSFKSYELGPTEGNLFLFFLSLYYSPFLLFYRLLGTMVLAFEFLRGIPFPNSVCQIILVITKLIIIYIINMSAFFTVPTTHFILQFI